MSTSDDRSYPARPILGVGALIIEADSIVLIQRGKEPLKGYWSIPGGAVETGERLEAALLREVREETGLEVEVVRLIEIFERIIKDDDERAKHHYVLIDYLCRKTGGELQSGDDACAVRWVPRNELDQYQITSGTLQVIEKAFCESLVG